MVQKATKFPVSMNTIFALSFLAFLAFAVTFALRWRGWRFCHAEAHLRLPQMSKASTDIKVARSLARFADTEIIPLEDFEWSIAEPLMLRTFKPQYHITMGIERLPTSDWIQIDKHYLSRIEERHSLIKSNRVHVLRALPTTDCTIRALYSFLVNHYLPKRYPQMFRILESSHLLNRVTGSRIPLKPTATAEDLLEELGEQIEEDFLILQPDEASGEFMLAAYMACFPNGFDWAKKLGKSMSQIHVPVPDYEPKLKKSMNRYLSRIEPGQTVKRHNWSISTTGNLFSVSNVHLYEGETIEEEEVDFDKACLRCERQVLHRLEGSNDLILTIRTYMYPLKDIKQEGNGPALAAAIDGLQQGSSPAMYFYKRAPNWSRSVKEFLLSGKREMGLE